MKAKIIDIIGHGIDPELAELRANEIIKLFRTKPMKEIAEYHYSLHCDNTMDKEKYWIIPAMIGAMNELIEVT